MKGFTLRRMSLAAIVSGAVLLASGCGDQFRPVATPIPQVGPQPAAPAFGLVVSNLGTTVPGVITSINLPGDTNQGQISVGIDPTYAMTPDGTRVLVADRGEDAVTIFSPLSSPLGAVLATVTLLPGSAPVYLTSNGATAWTVNPGRNTVGVVNLSTQTESTEVPVGHGPISLGFNVPFSQIYCVNNTDNTVTVISTKDNSILSTIAVGAQPVAAVSSNIGPTYVLNQGSGTVSQIDPNFMTVAATLPVGSNPTAMVYDATTRKLFVANSGSNSVSIIDADPQSIHYQTVVNVPVGTAPVALTALSSGSRVFVANSGSNDVTVIDTAGNRVLIPSVPVGSHPVSIASSADGSKVIVLNQGSNSVSLIETVHYTVTGTLSVPATPLVVNANP